MARLHYVLLASALVSVVTAQSDSPSCPPGQLPVSVEGKSTFCAAIPVCVGGFADGNCPGPQEGLPEGSHCGVVKSGVPGCVSGASAGDSSAPVISSPVSSSSPSIDNKNFVNPGSETTTIPSTAAPATTATPVPTSAPAGTNPPAQTNRPTETSPPAGNGGGANVPSAYPPSSPVNTMTAAFAQSLVEQHNIIRAWHNIGPVTWNAKAAASVQEFANTCPGFQHSKLGWENLASAPSKTASADELKKQVNPSWLWYNKEETLWNYGANTCTKSWAECGHFSNMMSPSVKEIGCGSSNCNGQSYVWCEYLTPVMNPQVPQPQGAKSSLCSKVYGCSASSFSTENDNVVGVPEASNEQTGASVGLIVGLTVGAAAFAGLIIAAIWAKNRRRDDGHLDIASTPADRAAATQDDVIQMTTPSEKLAQNV